MTSWAVAGHLYIAVKNGPTTLWEQSRSPGPFAAFGRLLTSWPWLLGVTCAYVALVGVTFAGRRSATGPLSKVATAVTTALGFTVVIELLTQSTAIGWLVLAGLIAAWTLAILRISALRRPPGHAAEVVDLQRWRERTTERRRSGRR
jgi:hypothetical protein